MATRSRRTDRTAAIVDVLQDAFALLMRADPALFVAAFREGKVGITST